MRHVPAQVVHSRATPSTATDFTVRDAHSRHSRHSRGRHSFCSLSSSREPVRSLSCTPSASHLPRLLRALPARVAPPTHQHTSPRSTTVLCEGQVPAITPMDAPNCALAAKAASGALQITVASDSDFIIQLFPETKPLTEKPANAPKRARVVQFRCSRAVLNEHSAFMAGIFRNRPDMVNVASGSSVPCFDPLTASRTSSPLKTKALASGMHWKSGCASSTTVPSHSQLTSRLRTRSEPGSPSV